MKEILSNIRAQFFVLDIHKCNEEFEREEKKSRLQLERWNILK